MTGQRKGVFEALFKQSGHFTAEQLLKDAQSLMIRFLGQRCTDACLCL